ncbi:uncharacterized protein LOC134827336 [Culicoides brevitarsis]|uniref:uncharacterized protein LOC134827336 n=1 Tax=Culicoides brevitarsis TaxID=469753 RepID=UPI00307B2C8B
MKFKILCLIFVILCENHFAQHVLATELSTFEENYIRNLFHKNLEEDYRAFSNEKLTPKIAAEISGRYNAFQESRRKRPDHSRIKREATQEGGVYVLDGFQEAGSIPVNFPIDICCFQIVKRNYAVALHKTSSTSNDTILSIFRRDDSNGEFIKIYEYNTKNAHYMDCTFSSIAGFVAVANYIDESEDFMEAIEGSSPVFRITSDEKVEIVLTFSTPYQNSIHFWKYNDNIFLTHTFKYPLGTAGARKRCPIYIWSERQFTLIDRIKCLNSFHIERFEIDHEMYVAVANFEDDNGKTDIFSYIYKYDLGTQSFQDFQKIETHAADDIRHFEFTYGAQHDDYLIVANQFEVDAAGNRNYETSSVIYKFINGYFVPLQSMVFDHVTHVMPVIGKNHEFLLLVACKNKAVQVYQYDGWNFVESTIDYTRYAFGDGVTSIRAYNNLAEATVIAISNENHKAGDTNFFFPLYTLKNDISQIYKKFREWVDATIDRQKNQNLEEILETLKKLPKINGPELTIYGKLELANAVVHRLDTWVLETPSLTLDNSLVERINQLHARIEQVKAQIHYLEEVLMPGKEHVEVAFKKDRPPVGDQTKNEEKIEESTTKAAEVVKETPKMTETPKTETTTKASVEEKVANPKEEEIVNEVIEVNDLYIKKKLTFTTINQRPANKMVRNFPNQALNLPKIKINGDVTFQDRLFVSDKIDDVKFSNENLLLRTGNQFFMGNLDAETIETNKLMTPYLNKEPTSVFLEKTLNEHVAQSRMAMHFDEIVVDELFVNGYFNDMDIRIFDSLLLKPEGDQVLEAAFAIETLNANNVVLLGGTLSGKHSQDLISAREGTHIIDSTVQFTHPIHAENLIVSERVNNIHVNEGRMDVLLKEANYTQVVTGPKVFDTVHLLNPIGLQGKINSQSLEKMNPLTTIDRNLVLKGDYEINGDVLIKNFMQSSDIIGRSGEFSANRLFRHGLTLDTTHSDKYFVFTQPIRIDDVYTKPSETFNPDDFVKTGSDEIQYVTGYKSFANDIVVKDGFCEANEINRVNLDELEKNVLKKTGDQVISGHFHLSKLTTPTITAEETSFENARLEEILTFDTPQTISGPVTIDSSVRVHNNIEARNLFSDGDFADGNLQYLVEDTVVRDGRHYHITAEKIFDRVTVDDLKFTMGTGKLNGIAMDTLVWDLDIFSDKYIHINDSLYQPKPLKIKNLHVTGAINGVNGADFGKCWLLHEGDQEFVAPITVDNLFVENLNLNGYLNGHNINYLYENTIWLNRDEHLGHVEAVAVTAMDPVTLGGHVSGMNLASDVLLRNSSYVQNVASLVAKSISVTDLTVQDTLNGVNYQKLVEFATNDAPMNVHVLGQINFLSQPVFKTINGIDIDELYEHAWLANRNAVLKATYYLENTEFVHNIISTGFVNDFDLDYISKNYFSLTQPQDIPGAFYFQNGTLFEHLKVDSVKLDGKIRGLNEQDFFVDINYLNEYAFKRGVEQEISGIWEIYQVNVDGDLNNVLINDYNFQDDVVRYDVPYNNITGQKFMENLHVNNVICAFPTCIIQETDVSEWLSNAVLVYGNYTIQGKTTVENVTVFGELRSVGTINGKKFDSSTVLLRDSEQTLLNKVFIRNKHQDRIVPVFFENLHVNAINGKNFNEILQKMVPRHGISSGVVNNLELYEPLQVRHLHTKGNPLFNVDLQQQMNDYEHYGDFSAYEQQFKMLENVGSYLEKAVTRPAYYLSHLELRKGISGAFTDVLPVKLVEDTYHLAAFDRDDTSLSVQFYQFNHTENRFDVDHFIPPLRTTAESGERILNVEIGHVFDMDNLILETQASTGEFIQTSLGFFHEEGFQRLWRLNTTHPTKSSPLRLSGMDCIFRYSEVVSTSEIACIGRNGIFLYQKLEGAPISQVVTLGSDEQRSNSVIVLTSDGNIVIYEPQNINENDKLTSPKQSLQPMNPSYIQAVTYDEYSYIAVCSDKTENAAHYGSIEIYRARKGAEFTHFQTISIKIPLKVVFSKLESNDLLMYVLTNNPSQSIIVYQYTGAAGFKEFIASSTLPRGKGIQMVRMPDEKREILAIITEKDVMFVEPILKK